MAFMTIGRMCAPIEGSEAATKHFVSMGRSVRPLWAVMVSDGEPYLPVSAGHQPGRHDRVFNRNQGKTEAMPTWRIRPPDAAYPVAWMLDVGGRTFFIKARMNLQISGPRVDQVKMSGYIKRSPLGATGGLHG
jgi:hypothetical protein